METKLNREKILGIAVAVGLLLLGGDYLVLQPLARSWRARSERIAEMTQRLHSNTQLLARRDTVLDRWDHMRTNALPSTATLAESKMFNAFDTWVRDSGVTAGSFRPQLRETDEGYSTLECRADVSGNMETIMNFLYDLEKDPTAIRLDSVELTSRDDAGQQLALVLEMSGLMLPSQQE